MSQEIFIGNPSHGQQVLKRIYKDLGHMQVDIIARNYIDNLVLSGMKNANPHQSEHTWLLEVESNCKIFANELCNDTFGIKAIIEIEDVKKTLARLCPLFPFC